MSGSTRDELIKLMRQDAEEWGGFHCGRIADKILDLLACSTVERALSVYDAEYQAGIRRAPSNRKGQGVSGGDVIVAKREAMRAVLADAGLLANEQKT